MPSERFITGQDMLQRVDDKDADALVKSVQDIAPDGATLIRPTKGV